MTVVGFAIERRLLKALKKGRVEPAPRTAAEAGEELGAPPYGRRGSGPDRL
jgi:hypothetical protein